MLFYLNGVKGVPREDGTDSSEPSGEEVLDLAGPLFLSHLGSFLRHTQSIPRCGEIENRCVIDTIYSLTICTKSL